MNEFKFLEREGCQVILVYTDVLSDIIHLTFYMFWGENGILMNQTGKSNFLKVDRYIFLSMLYFIMI